MTSTQKGQRSCLSCSKSFSKGELLRVVRTPSGGVVFDATGRAPGRGAYVCSLDCFQAACKKRKFDRALKCSVGSEVYDRIAVEVAQASRDQDK